MEENDELLAGIQSEAPKLVPQKFLVLIRNFGF